MKSYIKFSCIYCGQHIECEPQYSGRQFQCPACKQRLVVPPAQTDRAARPAAPANATWDTRVPQPDVDTPTRYLSPEESRARRPGA